MDTREEIQFLIKDALDGLADGIKKLRTQTWPETPMPRPKVFTLIVSRSKDNKGMVAEWPTLVFQKNVYVIHWDVVLVRTPTIEGSGYRYDVLSERGRHDLAHHLARLCPSPRDVVRCLSNIRTATAWCEARSRGMQKQAEEILRQQGKFTQVIEAEIVARRLSS